MKKAVSILAMTLCIVFLFSSCQSAEKKYNAGVEAMNAKNWDEAISCFSDLKYEDSENLLATCKKEKGMNEKADYKFINDLSKAVMKRHDLSMQNKDIEICIDYELNALSKYKDEDFYDKDLKALAVKYINGVQLQKNALSEVEGGQQIKHYQGFAERLTALKSLTDKYGLLKDNEDYIATYYNYADKAVENYEAIKAIEKDLDQLKNVDSDYVDDFTQRFVLKNHTKYSYDLSMSFTFYNSQKIAIDQYSTIYENIEPNQTRYLDFYWPSDAVSFNWASEEYLR